MDIELSRALWTRAAVGTLAYEALDLDVGSTGGRFTIPSQIGRSSKYTS